jgi:hypothetical protein
MIASTKLISTIISREHIRYTTGATLQPRHNHGDGMIFSKIYHGRWESYFET